MGNANKVLPPELEKKLSELRRVIFDLKSVVTAFSGGVDSTLVGVIAQDVLGTKAMAVTALSPSYPRSERAETESFVRRFNLSHEFISTTEVDDLRYRANPLNRCYFCKDVVYRTLIDYARKRGLSTVIDGFNVDDRKQHRPGHRIALELGIRSPLVDADINKEEVRRISSFLELPTADKPSMACLASRIPYGVEVTAERLEQVDAAEDVLREFGFNEFRVRWIPIPPNGKAAKIEVAENEFERLIQHRKDITERIEKIGFQFVTADLEGFSSGSFNKVLRP